MSRVHKSSLATRERFRPPSGWPLKRAVWLALFLGIGGAIASGWWVFAAREQSALATAEGKEPVKAVVETCKPEPPLPAAPAAVRPVIQPESKDVDLAVWAGSLTAADAPTEKTSPAISEKAELVPQQDSDIRDLLAKAVQAKEDSHTNSTRPDDSQGSDAESARPRERPTAVGDHFPLPGAVKPDEPQAAKPSAKPVPPPPIRMPEVTRTPDAQAASRLRAQIADAMRKQDLATTTTLIAQLGRTNCSAAVDCLLQLAFVPSPAIFGAVKDGLSEQTDPDALETLLKRYCTASGPNGWMAQALILDSFGQRESPPGYKAFQLAIKSDHPKVRLAAARSLARGKWSDVQAVPIFVAALEQAEKHADTGTLHWEIRSALVSRTGYDFSTAKDWAAFIAAKGTPDAASKGEMTQAVLKEELEYYGAKVISRRVLFIIDTSGSMAISNTFGYDDVPNNIGEWVGERTGKTGIDRGTGNWKPTPEWRKWEREHPEATRMERAKSELARLVSAMPKESYFNIIAFSTGTRSFKPTLVPATPDHVKQALGYVKGLHPGGNTESDKVLEEAFGKNWMADTLYFLSDGEPSHDGMDPLPIEPILDRVSELNRFAQIGIHALQVDYAGEGFMKGLVERTEGSYQNITDRPANPFWK